MQTLTRNKGFTLIELMMVVAIIAILVAVAYPSYQNYMIRASQAETQAFMQEVMSRAEQFRLDVRDYPEELDDMNITVPERVDEFYDITVARELTPPLFTVTATPDPDTRQASAETLTLNSRGNKTPAEEW